MSRPTLKITKREKVRASACTRAMVMIASAMVPATDGGRPAAMASTARLSRYGTAMAIVPVTRRHARPNTYRPR